MLAQLVRYAEEQGLAAEPGFTAKDVRWAILLGESGAFLGVLELGDRDDKRNRGRKFARAPHLQQPEIKKGGAGCRHFLVDNAEVVARLAGEEDAKLAAKHAYFVDLLRRAGAEVPSPALAACAAALADPAILSEIREQLTAHKARPTDNVTFAVGERYPAEADDWHPWWRAVRRGLGGEERAAAAEAGGRTMRCFASGELVRPVLTHPKIRGLADVGGIAMGDALASFKQDSFRSYGLEQSENVAMSEPMAAVYTTALNHLLANRSQRLGEGVRVVAWYPGIDPGEALEVDPLDALLTPEAATSGDQADAHDRLRGLLRAIDRGERPGLVEARYVSWVLSGAGGRVMVRDFAEGPFTDLVRTVAAWFDDLAIVRPDGEGLARPPKFFGVVGTLVRKDLKEVPAPTLSELWRAALHADFFPQIVATQALVRIRSDVLTDEPLRAHRFGVLRAYLLRQKEDPQMETGTNPGLNPEHPAAAYQCGRLMAALAALQRRALGDVGAGVVQRYYAAASATPGLVLGRLLRTAQYHLDKLDGGLRHWHEGRLAEIASRIGGDFPPTLSLHGQSLFALGYYHQLAEDRRKKTDATADSQETATDA